MAKISIHGHRGSRGTHPENTIPAFEEAVSAGANVLELDLQLTAEGEPVISHDPDLTGKHCLDKNGKPLQKPIPIRSLKLEELKTFDCGSIKHPDFPEQKTVPGSRIVTLREFFTWAAKKAPRLEFNIETKMSTEDPKWELDPDYFVKQVLALFREFKVVNKTILQSFDFRTLRVAKKLEPSLRLSCLFETEKDFCERTHAEKAQFTSPNYELVTPALVEKCHKLGIQVVPWTANTPEIWNTLIKSKVDAIISDYPRKLSTYLNRN